MQLYRLIVTFKSITMNHAAIAIMPACGAYHLRNLLVMSVNEFVYNYVCFVYFGFTNGSKLLKRLQIDHKQPDYEDYSAISIVQRILDVNGTLDAHSDVRKFGGDCNTVSTSSWGIHPNVKFMLLFFTFVVQHLCIHL